MKVLLVVAVLIALVGLAVCQDEIKSGRYSLITLDSQKPKFFKLKVPAVRSADVVLQANPVRCNGPIRLFASFKNQQPVDGNCDFQSGREFVGKITTLEIPQEAVVPSSGFLYIGVQSDFESGSDCTAALNGLLGHFQNMIHVMEGLSTYGNFTDQDDFHHFYEFKVNVTDPKPNGFLGVLVTGLDYTHPVEDQLQIYLSTKTSRPLPTSHQWQGLMVESGAFAAVLHTDPEFLVDSHYWIGVNTASTHRPIPYTVTFFHQGVNNSRVFLNTRTPQVGFSMVGDYTYYQAFIDSEADSGFVRLLNKVGSATMYVSTKTQTPTKDNYEWKGTFAEFKFQKEQPIYIGVMGEPGSPGVAVYDLFVSRN